MLASIQFAAIYSSAIGLAAKYANIIGGFYLSTHKLCEFSTSLILNLAYSPITSMHPI